MAIFIQVSDNEIDPGGEIELTVQGEITDREITWTVEDAEGKDVGTLTSPNEVATRWRATKAVSPGSYSAQVVTRASDGEEESAYASLRVRGPVEVQASADEVDPLDEIQLTAAGHIEGRELEWAVFDMSGKPVGEITDPNAPVTRWRATDDVGPGLHTARLVARSGETGEDSREIEFRVKARPYARGETIPVRLDSPIPIDLQRPGIPDTADLPLWEIIKLSTEAISFDNYKTFMDFLFCGAPLPRALNRGRRERLGAKWRHVKTDFADELDPDTTQHPYSPTAGAPLPFPDIEAYKVLKAATEAFLMINCDVVLDRPAGRTLPGIRSLSPSDRERLGLEPGDSLRTLWNRYLISVDGDGFIPYLYLVRQKLGDIQLTTGDGDRAKGELCNEILKEKFTSPCLLELIWSYWHEEGMLVQTLNAISMRFQNRRGPAEVDPLANLEIDPLRPLSNLLWGYIQDEQHRLTVPRRAYEYDHEYGITLFGRAVPAVRGADSRSKFLEAFHHLLHRAAIFYKEDDDTTMIADPFPVLNALRDVHLLLAEGAHNQYGDLPWTARHEMLMQQWLLSRPEFREFLPTRVMVVYPEPWMDRVDAMKRLQGWTDTSVRFFHDLAVFGEQILLSIRYGNWSNVFDREQAANWARFWRQEVQWYIHAYHTVTGVDLSAEMADVRQAEAAQQRALQPAVHLRRRLVEQQRRTTAQVSAPARAQPALPSPTQRVTQ